MYARLTYIIQKHMMQLQQMYALNAYIGKKTAYYTAKKERKKNKEAKMEMEHQSHYDDIKVSNEKNSGERLVVDEMSMTLKEAVATLAIRGDILQARRSAIGGFSIDKETAYSGIERAQTNPQYIDTIKRMQIKRETQIQLQKLAEESQKEKEKTS